MFQAATDGHRSFLKHILRGFDFHTLCTQLTFLRKLLIYLWTIAFDFESHSFKVILSIASTVAGRRWWANWAIITT